MGRAYQCDRCGLLVGGAPAGNIGLSSDGSDSFSGELCKDCVYSAAAWWEANND